MRPDRSVLGMMLPGSSTLPHDDPRLGERAEAAGSRAVELVAAGVRPEQVLTREAFAVALRALAAVGGSTNAVLHLCAIAGRRMVPLALEDFDAAARTTPVLADVAPIGRHTIAAFDAAGGLQEVLRRLAEPTATPADRDEPAHRTPADGRTFARSAPAGQQAIRDVADPVTEQPALVVLRGNLAPDGAILKAAAGRPELLRHTGPAVVFHGYADLLARIDDPGLDVTADSVLVLTGCGPRGGDGFPEWGLLPIPTKLARQGVRDMVRISDARMSGTSFGTCILHVAPEAAVGGPLAAVRDGDLVTVDIDRRSLDVAVPAAELARRLAEREQPAEVHRRGWPALYAAHVLQAPEGADLDFLRPRTADELRFVDPVVGRS